jgi:hypothetical protein
MVNIFVKAALRGDRLRGVRGGIFVGILSVGDR